MWTQRFLKWGVFFPLQNQGLQQLICIFVATLDNTWIYSVHTLSKRVNSVCKVNFNYPTTQFCKRNIGRWALNCDIHDGRWSANPRQPGTPFSKQFNRALCLLQRSFRMPEDMHRQAYVVFYSALLPVFGIDAYTIASRLTPFIGFWPSGTCSLVFHSARAR